MKISVEVEDLVCISCRMDNCLTLEDDLKTFSCSKCGSEYKTAQIMKHTNIEKVN